MAMLGFDDYEHNETKRRSPKTKWYS